MDVLRATYANCSLPAHWAKKYLAIDPGYQTGCKVAVIDKTVTY